MLLISSSSDDDRWKVSIIDNGVGINSGDERQDSYGLTGMFERADNIGAEISIISPLVEKNFGTEIVISVPIEAMVASRSHESQ